MTKPREEIKTIVLDDSHFQYASQYFLLEDGTSLSGHDTQEWNALAAAVFDVLKISYQSHAIIRMADDDVGLMIVDVGLNYIIYTEKIPEDIYRLLSWSALVTRENIDNVIKVSEVELPKSFSLKVSITERGTLTYKTLYKRFALEKEISRQIGNTAQYPIMFYGDHPDRTYVTLAFIKGTVSKFATPLTIEEFSDKEKIEVEKNPYYGKNAEGGKDKTYGDVEITEGEETGEEELEGDVGDLDIEAARRQLLFPHSSRKKKKKRAAKAARKKVTKKKKPPRQKQVANLLSNLRGG